MLNPLAGTSILTENPLPIVSGANQWTRLVLLPFTTNTATPTTPILLRRTLDLDSDYRIKLEVLASDSAGSEFEVDARNAYARRAGGSSRLGTVNGQQLTVGNSFPPPANTRPKVTFTDPTDPLTLHLAWPLFTGRAGVLITWCVVAFVQVRL